MTESPLRLLMLFTYFFYQLSLWLSWNKGKIVRYNVTRKDIPSPPVCLFVVNSFKALKACKVMTNLDSILKSRHYFASKGPSSQGYGFSSSHVWMWVWTIKKAEHWRIDAFELWCWRSLLRVLWTARRSNQSILKEINLEYSLEGLMLKLKLWYFGHLMQRTDLLERP